MNKILVIEDEAVIRSALRRLLDRHGYETAEAESVEEAKGMLEAESFGLIIADIRLPGAPGTDIISASGGVPVLIMTSYASVQSAVESMQLGAVDYIAKPFDHEEMLLSVARVFKASWLKRQNEALRSDIAKKYPVAEMVGDCPAMREVCDRIRKVAPTDATVLILGESGTGKELVARAVHERSKRREAPMVTVNCAAIPSTLIESELFGHEKGAFTGAVGARKGLLESADGGTVFLDEIGELPLDAQARLLRVLQEGEIRRVGAADTRRVDVRIVAATHRDLRALVDARTFRDDLYFRLRVLEVRLPPLRDRGDDVPKLAVMLLQRTRERLHAPPLRFHKSALDAIVGYTWPGNVRELENAIERAVILCEAPEIHADLLALDLEHDRHRTAEPHGVPTDATALTLSLEEYFERFVTTHQESLSETELAQRLGISRKALWERRQRLGIARPKRKS